MTTTIFEGLLTFRFSTGCLASTFDQWAFYRNQFQAVAGGCKAIDVLCVADNESWLIEVKDYRQHRRINAIDVADEIAIKVRDTLPGLASLAKTANDDNERQLAQQSLAEKAPMASFTSLGTANQIVETEANVN